VIEQRELRPDEVEELPQCGFCCRGKVTKR
jgi:hypothetical protein